MIIDQVGYMGFILIIAFYLFSNYFIQFSFRGLLIESFRSSIMEVGYPIQETSIEWVGNNSCK